QALNEAIKQGLGLSVDPVQVLEKAEVARALRVAAIAGPRRVCGGGAAPDRARSTEYRPPARRARPAAPAASAPERGRACAACSPGGRPGHLSRSSRGVAR